MSRRSPQGSLCAQPFPSRSLETLLFGLVLALLGPALLGPAAALGATPDEILSVNDRGIPTFVEGELGFVDPLGDDPNRDPNGLSTDAHLFRLSTLAFAHDFAVRSLAATGREEFHVLRAETDDVGMVHVRLGQTLDGLPVDGAQLIVHADAATGAVVAVNGEFAPAEHGAASTGSASTSAPSIDAGPALAAALADLGLGIRHTPADSALTYVLDDADRAVLAWKARVAWVDEDGPHADWIYADAHDGALVARHPTIYTGKTWSTYDAGGGGLPGGLACVDDQPCPDLITYAAHLTASLTYDYYFDTFGRDSLDDNCAPLLSTVDFGTNYNNAFFNGERVVYGSGDGVILLPLALAFDIGVHEFTHAVTLFTSGLIYQNESGALNESASDVFAAAAEAWRDGGVNADNWKLAEDVFTPGVTGDAVRYLDDPAADGTSADYYPDRYVGSGDNGGVHINSGIGNLAFYLLTEGGQHPRGKTTNTVPGIGIRKAEQIVYRAHSFYLTPSANYEAMRFATAASADDLYGLFEVAAVHESWSAVGVPGGGNGSNLANGVPITGLSGAAGSQKSLLAKVPKTASTLEIEITGGTGDVDLYVRRGSQPTLRLFDCRSAVAGNEETCTLAAPLGGFWHIMLYGYSSYSGVTLVATWQ